ncbi:MAG: sigma-70 family RNA polymerase sigma factor [Pirellulales bacterium]
MVDWDQLVDGEGASVWQTIYRILRNRADADECFQETFLAALKFSARSAVLHWPALLQRLAVACAVDRLRQRLRRTRREVAVDLAVVASAELDPAEHAETNELVSTLRWALAQLTARQAEIFCLHELEEWSYQEIAEHFSLSTSAVGVQLHRTRHELKRLLGGTIDKPV